MTAKRTPFAEAALDYLKLNPEEKIRWREERNLTLAEWYRSFKVQKPFEEDVKPTDLLGWFAGQYKLYSLIEKGAFGEKKTDPRNGRITLDKDAVNARLEEAARLVPVNAIINKKQSNDNEWLVTRRYLDDEFEDDTYVQYLSSQERYVSILDAAKITTHLRERRAMITDWKTIYDLNKESGVNFPPKAASDRYHRLHKEGKFQIVRVSMFDVSKKQGFHGVATKIPPRDYERILEEEKKFGRILKTHLTSRAIAEKYGVRMKRLGHSITIAEKRGLIKPVYVDSPYHQGKQRLLSPEDAELIASGELDLRPLETIHREKELYRRILERKGATTKDLAELLDIHRTYAAQLVHLCEAQGLIHPARERNYSKGGSNGYFLSTEDVDFLRSYFVKHERRRFRNAQYHQEAAIPSSSEMIGNHYAMLWSKTKEGDQDAFLMLLNEYKSIFNSLMNKWSMSSTHKEKKAFLQTGLYEIVHGHNALPKQNTYYLLERSLERRLKEERLLIENNLLSYDQAIDGDYTILDAIERGQYRGSTDEL